jgi:hypothetical protein
VEASGSHFVIVEGLRPPSLQLRIFAIVEKGRRVVRLGALERSRRRGGGGAWLEWRRRVHDSGGVGFAPSL